jgi:hypothetical protein
MNPFDPDVTFSWVDQQNTAALDAAGQTMHRTMTNILQFPIGTEH